MYTSKNPSRVSVFSSDGNRHDEVHLRIFFVQTSCGVPFVSCLVTCHFDNRL